MPIFARAVALAAAGAAALAPLASAAHDRAEGLLPAPPAHAPAGVCYAHVTAPAEYGPPPVRGAHWRLSPPPPGAPGPVWCLVVDPASPAPLIAPEREGWVRVLCDADRTPARIGRMQRRLRALGDYAGEASGRYDAATARAVGRFQRERRIAHAGYLSWRTMEAIGAEGPGYTLYAPSAAAPAPVVPPPPPPVVILPTPEPRRPPWLTWPGKTEGPAGPAFASAPGGACGGCVR